MKHLKKFENINKPEVGDYVICKNIENEDLSILDYFLSENIGIIINNRTDFKKFPYLIRFDDMPHELLIYSEKREGKDIIFRSDEILHFSKNKEDLEHIIVANKYNL